MDKDWIKNLAGSEIFSRGMSYYRTGKVLKQIVSESEEYLYEFSVSTLVRGSSGCNYVTHFDYNCTDGQVWDEHCTCPAYLKYPGICKHITASLLHFSDNYENLKSEYFPDIKFDNYEGKYVEDSEVQSTTSGLKKLIYQSITPQISIPTNLGVSVNHNEPIRIEAYLEEEYNEFSLQFKLGYSQMYVLKNIYDFVENIDYETSYKYGKNLEFIHKMNAFDEASKCFVKYLVDYTSRNPRRYYGYGYNYGYSTPTKSISMDINELERFLTIIGSGARINAKFYRKQAKVYTVAPDPTPRKLTITGDADGAEIKVEKISGYASKNKFIYFLDDQIYIDDRKDLKEIEPFLDLLTTIPDRTLYLENADIPSFMVGLYPILEKFYKIKKKNFDGKEVTLPEPSFEIYLDAKSRDYITARIMAVYGENSFNIYMKSNDLRNIPKETAMGELVSPLFDAFEPDERELVIANDESRIYQFIAMGIDRLKTLGEVFVSNRLKKYMIKKPQKLEVGLSLSGDLIDFSIKEDSLSMEELAELLSKYNPKTKYYRLKNGEFVDLSDMTNLDEASLLVDQLGITDRQLKSGKVSLPKFRALYLDDFEKSEEFYIQKNDEFCRLVDKMQNYNQSKIRIPKAQKDILRNYQKTGYKWLKNLSELGFGGILADDMGLGKTIQVITFIQSIREKEHRPVIIICPASLVYNWGAELNKFSDNLKYTLMVGTSDTRKAILSEDLTDQILITSYDLLRRDIEEYSGIQFYCQIIDEAQYIKNHNTQLAHAVKNVDSVVRFALTGTPIENRVSELWSIFDYLMPGYLHSYQRFHDIYEQQIMNNADEDVTKQLRSMIRPFVLRRLKKDVLKDLPDKIEEDYICQMEGEQEQLYRAHVERLRILLDNQTDDEFKKGKIQILAELTKLRQLCCDPALLYDDYRDGSTKTQMCLDLISEAIEGGHKVLLFSQFTSMLDILIKELNNKKIKYHLITGQTSKQNRSKQVEEFATDDTKVFCISLKAGGTGLNLTAADIVIHFDPWWNVAAQNQATDRAHRIGQDQVVTVYKLIAKGTIEERIIELQKRKKEIADSLLSGDDFESGSFTREELLNLLY